MNNQILGNQRKVIEDVAKEGKKRPISERESGIVGVFLDNK